MVFVQGAASIRRWNALTYALKRRKVGYVLDADIRGFGFIFTMLLWLIEEAGWRVYYF